jgi:hypothetical protein
MTFLRNIGADLVEKRLWPVAVALLVALVAVPTLLASSPSEKPAGDETSPAVASAAADTATAVTLNTKPVGRRARGGSSKNPFKQLFVQKVEDETAATGEAAQAGGETGSKDSSPDTGGSKTGGAPKSDDKDSKPKSGATVYKATLRFGQPGDMRTITDIARLTPLPSIENPFFVFLGVKEDGKTLVFLVSSDAKATGDGKCVPKATCETIEMKAGDTETFNVTNDSGTVEQYQMDVVKVSKSQASSAKAARAARKRHSKAGAALLTVAREESGQPDDLLGRYKWDSTRGVLDVVKLKANAAKVVGPIAATSAVVPEPVVLELEDVVSQP